MAVLDRGRTEPDTVQHPPVWPEQSAVEATVPLQHPAVGADDGEGDDTESLIHLHDSIAALLASRGQWQQAYEHLRHALGLITSQIPSGRTHTPYIPEGVRQEVARLRQAHAEALEHSIRDALTASYNRRYLDQRLVSLVEQQHGHADGLAVALVDLDWFKQVNDTYGHLIGDRVLQRIVELLQHGLPSGGFCARYGGEEFVLVLPGIDGDTALDVAESARIRIERYPWAVIAPGLRVTVSIGLAHEPSGVSGSGTVNPEQQLRHADGLLYAAKQSGRNMVAYHLNGEMKIAGTGASRRSGVAARASIPGQASHPRH